MSHEDIYIGLDGTGYEATVIRFLLEKQIKNPEARRNFEESAGYNATVMPNMKKMYRTKRDEPMPFVDVGKNPIYAKEFVSGGPAKEGGNVFRHWLHWGNDRRYYRRGPEAEGFTVEQRVSHALRWYLAQRRNTSAEGKLFVCGYSRGGYEALRFAEELAERHAVVDCLMLYDAVKRTMSDLGNQPLDPDSDGMPVPRNVIRCLHLHRNYKVSKSRVFMGNCGKTPLGGGNTSFLMLPVTGTHSALGGLPYTTPAGTRGTDIITETGSEEPTAVSYNDDAKAAHSAYLKMTKFVQQVRRENA